jgi:hypothetical protein
MFHFYKKSGRLSSRRKRIYEIAGLAGLVLLLSAASIAFATLNFNGSSISGDSNIVLDGAGTIAIGTSTATGVTIGRSGITSIFPGAVTIGTSTVAPGAMLTIAASSNILTTLANGNVGIGTDAPIGTLDVAPSGSVKFRIATSGNAAFGDVDLDYYGGKVTDEYQLSLVDSQPTIEVYDEDDFSGTIEIESSSSSVGLENSGSALPQQGGQELGTTPDSGLFFHNVSNGAGSNGIFIVESGNAPIVFGAGGYAAADERMRITNTGKVGIGTSAPSSTLHVLASTSSTVEVGNSSHTGCLELGSASGTPTSVVYVYFDTKAVMYSTTTKPAFCQ